MKKREFVDNRDWKKYNEELVMRGYFYINPAFLLTWNDELKKMNAGKVGEPYLYPESMIKFLAVLHCKGNDYRALEGIMKALSENFKFQFPVIVHRDSLESAGMIMKSFEIYHIPLRNHQEINCRPCELAADLVLSSPNK
jgi:hypothetical protein